MTDLIKEMKMFGLTIAQMEASKPAIISNGLYAMSIMSDVQEVLYRLGENLAGKRARLKLLMSDAELEMVKKELELSRQWLNKAKYFISQNLDKEGRVL